MSNFPHVTIVVLNWNGWQDTLECLSSLDNLSYPSFSIIVVDNASTDRSEEKILAAYPKLLLIQNAANLGFAGGNNVGIRYALQCGTDFVWLLNNDTLVEPNALTCLVERAQRKPKADICGSTLIYNHDRNLVQAYGGGIYNKWLGQAKKIGQGKARNSVIDVRGVELELDYIEASSLLVSRRFLETVGPMKEDYFLYFEEVDWFARAGDDFSLGYAADSIVYHKEGASTGASDYALNAKSLVADYYSVRNRILITRRYYPYALPTLYLSLFLVILNRVRRRQWRRVLMIFGLALGKNWMMNDNYGREEG